MNENEQKAGWTGRADYEERREARKERLQDRAEMHRAREREASRRAFAEVADIPFGQPNIRGALTPAIKRSDAASRVAMREAEEATRAEDALEAAERNTAISSDDPKALDKLREKLAKMERMREDIKEANKLCRGKDRAAAEAKLKEMGVKEESWGDMLDGRLKGFPPFMLSNLTANIGRVKERIEQLERRATEAPPEGWEFDGGKVEVNVEANRVQVRFAARQGEEVTRRLKANGFHWSRWERAWQRQLNPRSVGCARVMFPKEKEV